MSGWLTALFIFLGSLVTGGVTWLIARRSKSGDIETSEASSLWDESKEMRKELREEANTLRAELETERKARGRAEELVFKLREELAELRGRLDVLEGRRKPRKP